MKEKENKKAKKAKKVKKTVSPKTKKKAKAKSPPSVRKKKKSSGSVSASSSRKKVAPKPRRKKSGDLEQQTLVIPEAESVKLELPEIPVDEVELDNDEAESLFIPEPVETEENKDDEYLLFRSAGEGYALQVSDVHEILRHQRITKVPGSARHVVGATSLRGAIIPVVSVASLLLSVSAALPSDGRILLLSGSDTVVGLLVEKQIGLRSFNLESILPPLSIKGGEGSPFVEGVLDVDGEFYTVLRPDAITRTKATGRLDEKKA